uniref:Aminoacyl tRNA synthetase complex interacting multifunctional protein 1b n=1 Tax=Seriola dumerili TaxID=41447 RepID=A0A3B4T2L3_SERDU
MIFSHTHTRTRTHTHAHTLWGPDHHLGTKSKSQQNEFRNLELFRILHYTSHILTFLQASVRDQKKLLVENAKLKKDIEQLRNQLQDKQRRRTALAAVPTNPHPPSTFSQDRRDRQSRRRRGDKKGERRVKGGRRPRVDVSRLDLRVGRILSVRRHPLAETMSIQEVDMGENAPRTVVSKLGGKIHLEEGGLVVLLCNVKACKMRGVASQARLLCCSTSDDCIELLAAPMGSTPGDRVTFLNYPGDPDRELPSKQRVWELLQPDLQVDSRGVANYKGCGFEVKGKGLCRAPSLTNCIIR